MILHLRFCHCSAAGDALLKRGIISAPAWQTSIRSRSGVVRPARGRQSSRVRHVFGHSGRRWPWRIHVQARRRPWHGIVSHCSTSMRFSRSRRLPLIRGMIDESHSRRRLDYTECLSLLRHWAFLCAAPQPVSHAPHGPPASRQVLFVKSQGPTCMRRLVSGSGSSDAVPWCKWLRLS